MFSLQSQPPRSVPPLSPPSVSQTINPQNGGTKQENLARDTTAPVEQNRGMLSSEKTGSKRPVDCKHGDQFNLFSTPQKKEEIVTDTAAKESAVMLPTNTAAAVVPPPITSVTSSLSSIPAREGLRLTHGDPEAILPGRSRSGEVKLDFDRTGYNVDRAQLLLQQKHSELLKNGYTTLIGKIAQRVDKEITTDHKTVSHVEKSETPGAMKVAFKPNSLYKPDKTYRPDIKSGSKTYLEIIQDMHDAKECSPRTAFLILENLSKGYERRRDYELFLNLPKNAQNLMAVLICEAIRFQEDGALERMAIRKVLSLFSELSTPSVSTTSATASSSGATESPVATNYSDIQSLRFLEDNPFYKVFVSDIYSEDSPLAIFAATQDAKKVGGKRRQLDLIEGEASGNNTHYTSDQGKLLVTTDCLSDSEEQKEKKGTEQEAPHTPTKNVRKTSSGRPVITPKKVKETPSPKKTRSRVLTQKAGKGKNKKWRISLKKLRRKSKIHFVDSDDS